MADRTIREQNEAALDLFADLMEPVAEILADPDARKLLGTGSLNAKVLRPLIKGHKSQIIEILARLHGQEPDEYKVNLWMLPFEVVKLVNRPEVQDFLALLAQTEEDDGSGSATENI